MNSKLISRNIIVNGHRTSIRLEGASWDAIDDICQFESLHINELCTAIDLRRRNSSRTAAVRAFIVTYFHRIVMESDKMPGNRVNQLISDMAI